MQIQINGTQVYETDSTVQSVSMRTSRGEAGLARIDDQTEDVNILVQTLAQSETATSTAIAAPVADAGGPVSAANAASVEMDGSASTGEGITFLWERVTGPTTPTLNDEDTDTCTWTSHATTDGIYVYSLTVTDENGNTDVDYAVVTIA